ncbi:MAG: DNA polymerase III subunit epsilon [Alphaproteobacteria bacterium]|nr:MAG: DNA polymerase III subunit epsilon [Alphaproteobacteria bacterium]
MREIILDTETTGLDPKSGHRIVEIGCVELFNHLPTGNTYHQYINPQRFMPSEASRIHGITDIFLEDKPLMESVIHDFLTFIGDSPLVIHNAAFDMKFLNAELVWLNLPEIPMVRAIDTLRIARQKFPGSPASLDALCKRFGIDNAMRDKHGALLDSYLLADVYLELIGGRQPNLQLQRSHKTDTDSNLTVTRPYREPRTFPPCPADTANHDAFMRTIANSLWSKTPNK